MFILNNTVFTIAASGGDLAPNHTAYWDIVASPRDLTFPDECSGEFDVRARKADGDDIQEAVVLGCNARAVPLDAEPRDVSFGVIGPTTARTRRRCSRRCCRPTSPASPARGSAATPTP